MQGIEYVYELCEALPRSGPGDNASTKRAFDAIPMRAESPLILDIGCGQGMQTIELAKLSHGEIIAVDNHQGFLDLLMKHAESEGLAEHIIAQNISMLKMNFKAATFDIIWSEGALYIMGFEKGLKCCHKLLKPRGCLAVSELVFLDSAPPQEVVEQLKQEYSAIATVDVKLQQIDEAGFSILEHFTLPESSWLDNYYLPMEDELPRLRSKYQDDQLALSVVDEFSAEVDFYKQNSAYFGYQFFVMQKN